MKKLLIGLIAVVILGVAAYFLFSYFTSSLVETTEDTPFAPEVTQQEGEDQTNEPRTVIGSSAEGREIVAHHYGSGDTRLLFVGGIHGGYSWNTSLVAYELMEHLEQNPSVIPQNVSVTVIPVLNPDGLFEVVGTTERFTRADVPSSEAATVPGRYNGNGVDLNRNFDCDWQSTGVWQNTEVDGGSAAFSEPESRAVRDFIAAEDPAAVVIWYSAAGGVFASNCHNDILPETRDAMNTFAQASGYKAFENYNFYEITGDMANWLAKERVPAISVLLTTHTDTEWSKNRAGVEALLQSYAN